MTNIHNWCLEQTTNTLQDRGLVSEQDIYLVVEQTMRDWDLYGPRLTDNYELTDDQWEDIVYSVCELVTDKIQSEDRLCDS